jgi:hypothetical protein
VAGCCRHDNKPTGSDSEIRDEEAFLDEREDWYVLKKDRASSGYTAVARWRC